MTDLKSIEKVRSLLEGNTREFNIQTYIQHMTGLAPLQVLYKDYEMGDPAIGSHVQLKRKKNILQHKYYFQFMITVKLNC